MLAHRDILDRLDRQMHKLRAVDLAMAPSEIIAVLAAHRVTLATRDFSILAARTQGWAARVKLSASRMEGTSILPTFDQGLICMT